jgi:hypothetical protein
MLEVLVEAVKTTEVLPTQMRVPDEVLTCFGKECEIAGLIDDLGNFNNPLKLVQFFCAKIPSKPKKPNTKKSKES